jgi:hypothetical protein
MRWRRIIVGGCCIVVLTILAVTLFGKQKIVATATNDDKIAELQKQVSELQRQLNDAKKPTTSKPVATKAKHPTTAQATSTPVPVVATPTNPPETDAKIRLPKEELKRRIVELQRDIRDAKTKLLRLQDMARIRGTDGQSRLSWQETIDHKADHIKDMGSELAEYQRELKATTSIN